MASVKQENCANGLKKAYDVIVVGGGSAGAVLAARLSENPDCQVALLEGGPVFAPDAWPDELAQSHSVGGGDYVWERGVATGTDHTAGHLRAKVLGGGSTINAGAFVRAPKSDFDRWVKRGLSDWSYPGSNDLKTPTMATIAGMVATARFRCGYRRWKRSARQARRFIMLAALTASPPLTISTARSSTASRSTRSMLSTASGKIPPWST